MNLLLCLAIILTLGLWGLLYWIFSRRADKLIDKWAEENLIEMKIRLNQVTFESLNKIIEAGEDFKKIAEKSYGEIIESQKKIVAITAETEELWAKRIKPLLGA